MNEENKNTTKPDDKKETTPELKEFDFNGVKLYAKSAEEFEKAKELQKNLHKGYNELKAEKDKIDAAKAEAERKAELAELAKNQKWEEIEAKTSEKYINQIKEKDELIGKFHGRIIDSELSKMVASQKDILPETHNIIIKLLKADNKFELDGDTLKAGGKPAADVIKSFLKENNTWAVHKSPAGTGAAHKTVNKLNIADNKSPKDLKKEEEKQLSSLLKDAYNKNKSA